MHKLSAIVGSACLIGVTAGVVSGCGRASNAPSLIAPAIAPPKRGAAVPPPLPPGTLTGRELKAYAYAKRQFAPADQFSKEMDDSALFGRKFGVEVPTPPGGPVLAEYNASDEVLTIFVSTNEVEGEYGDGWFNYISLDYHKEYGNPSPMSNAFGATVEVTPVSVTEVGIGSFKRDLGVFQPMSGLMAQLKKKIPMRPDAARLAVASMKLQIEGTIAKNKAGHTIKCFVHAEQAKIDTTFPVKTDICAIAARFQSVRVITSTGTLAEWRAR